MDKDIKFLGMLLGTVLLIAVMLTGYNLYTDAKRREMYVTCLDRAAKPELGRFGVMCSTY